MNKQSLPFSNEKGRKIIAISILIIVVGMFWVVLSGNKSDKLANPSPVPTDTPAPTPNAPKTFKFDSSTDLKAELEKVNPQVLDSDFE